MNLGKRVVKNDISFVGLSCSFVPCVLRARDASHRKVLLVVFFRGIFKEERGGWIYCVPCVITLKGHVN